MKKIVIFGATGTIGQHLVDQALDSGYLVSAFCRNPNKLSNLGHPNLNPISGNVLTLSEVEQAVEGQDAVAIVLGSGKSRKSTVRSEGTKNIIRAMEHKGVKRLICQSTLGTKESNDNLNFFWKRIMFGWFLKQVFLDHELQESLVEQSNLEWTIVRPGAFTDGEKTENYLHGFSPKDRSVKLKISRADVADFILRQIEDNRYLKKSPGLSY